MIHWPTRVLSAATFLFTLFVLVGLEADAAAQARSPHDVKVETEMNAEVAAIGPEGKAHWDEANRLYEGGDLRGAKDRLERLVQVAPRLDHPHRFLCVIHLQLALPDAAAECRKALELRGSPRNRSRLAMALMDSPATRSEAERLLATDLDVEDEGARTAECALALHRSVDARADRGFTSCTERLVTSFPSSIGASVLRVQGYLVQGDRSAAETELARARSLGLPQDRADALQHGIDDQEPLASRFLKKFVAFVAVWLTLLVVLWAVGGRLSASAMKAVEVAMQGTQAPISSGERRIRKLYRAAIAIAGAYFFLSLPVIALVTVVCALLVVAFFLVAGYVPIKLLVIVAVVALVTLGAVVKSVVAVFRDKESDPGEELDLKSEPAIHALLCRVAKDLETRPVDRVFVTQGTDMAVYERGGPLTTMRGAGERCLVLGVALLDGFRVGGFKSVLAHEYGHFKNEDTAGGHLALAVRRSTLHMVIAMAKGGAATWYNPAWWFVRGYHRVFLRITQGASRLQEVLADRAAVLTYGSAAFTSGFRHVIARSAAFDLHAKATVLEAASTETVVTNFYRFEPSEAVGQDELESHVEEELGRPSSDDDSHPPPRERIALAERMASAGAALDPAGDDEEVWSLFANREALEVRMTARIRDAVRENHGVTI